MTATPSEPGSEASLPVVSVIMPVRNEARFIEGALAAVLAQDYPAGRFEVIVADGQSTDGTREIVLRIASKHPSVRLVDNPGRFVSSGLNRALEESHGQVIVRLDGHGEYPSDYVRRVVTLRDQTGAANAGGVLVPVGTNYVQRSMCAALSSPFGMAGSAMRGRPVADDVRDVDAVNGGCWLRQTLVAAGGFSEEMVRNQDDEMSFRLRKAGGRVVQSSSIRFHYVVRDRWARVFRQYVQYGFWKVRVLRKHPRQASVRHIVPALLVAILLVGFVGALFARPIALGAVLVAAVYLFAVALAALVAAARSEFRLWPGVLLAFVFMHIGYGGGFLLGLAGLVGNRRLDAWFSRLTR